MFASILAVLLGAATLVSAAPTHGVGTKDNGSTLQVYVTNTTSKSAWVTMYWGYSSQPGWHIDEAQCVKAHSSWRHNLDFHLGLGRPEAKLRSEIKNDVNCSPNSTAADFWSNVATRDAGKDPVVYTAPQIVESGGHYEFTGFNWR